MNVKERVLEIRKERNFEAFEKHLIQHPNELSQMVQLIFDQEEYPYAEYSSWILVHFAKKHPEKVIPFYEGLIDVLFKSKNQSVLRNVTNIIQSLSITDYRESDLIDLLIGFIQDYENKVALQVYSMYALIQFTKRYPELKNEIIEIIEINAEGKSAAYRAAHRNYLKKTKKL